MPFLEQKHKQVAGGHRRSDSQDWKPGISRRATGRAIEVWRLLVPQLLALAGNMDSAAIDERLGELGVPLDGRGIVLVGVGVGVGVCGVSAARVSPLQTPYELADDELERRSERAFAAVAGARRTVFCPHAPPLDTACDLLRSGEHAGSVIRRFVEREQPDVVLCGHIHEARGTDAIGSRSRPDRERTVGGSAAPKRSPATTLLPVQQEDPQLFFAGRRLNADAPSSS
jgi:hypothetical protein